MFVAYLDGPGQQVGSGGRYDRLFRQLGAPQVGAAGFSIALDVLLEARRAGAGDDKSTASSAGAAGPSRGAR
jgi:histidyl-tRNA synthetase